MRSTWTGAISFGLVYIPVRMITAVEPPKMEFNLLRRRDLCSIRYARVCRDTGEEVPYADIVRGYEYRQGEYVVLEDQDFEKARGRRTKTIELLYFVHEDEIESKYLEKPFYLEPQEGAEKVYALLREALRKSDKVGIARFVLQHREHMAMLKAEGPVILLDQMRFAGELRVPEDLTLPIDVNMEKREINSAVQIINLLTQEWDPRRYRDTYVEELQRIIDLKIQGKEPEPLEEEPVVVEENSNLLSQLDQSLEMIRSRARENSD